MTEIGVLELCKKVTFGTNKRGAKLYSFVSLNNKKFIVASKMQKTQNQICIVKPTQDNKAEIVDILGDWNDERIREKTLMIFYNIRQPKINVEINYSLDYVDLTRLNTISIDPLNCVDVDDCMSFETFDNYSKLYIHIVDITTFENDINLFHKQSSLYGNCETYHLLPINIMKKLSFLENKNRHAITLEFRIDYSGTINNFVFYKSLIKNKKQYDYDNVDKLLNTDDYLMTFYKLCKNIKSNINVSIIDSHTWIEYLMILCNHSVAKYCLDNKIDIIYRTHQRPTFDLDDIDEDIRNEIKFKYYSQGEYSLNCNDHFGLDLNIYTHFTSPLRRYCDQYNHRKIFGKINDINKNEIDEMNDMNKQIKKFHNQMKLNIIEENNYECIISEIQDKKLQVYITSVKQFLKFRIFPRQLDNLVNYEPSEKNLVITNIQTEDKISFNIFDKIEISVKKNNNNIIPKNKLKIDLNIKWFTI